MSKAGILVILNPVSGQQDFGEAKQTIESALEEAPCKYEVRETRGEGDAYRWAKEAEDFSLVLVGGGDGTVMEAMSGVIESRSDLPLAQLPMGTANLLARALAIPIDLSKALSLALGEGVATEMDVGYLKDHERYFALVAGSGWDARLIEDADRELKNKLGFFAYVVTGIKNLFQLENSKVRLILDGKESEFRAHTVEVINIGEIHGTGVSLGEGMSPHDGKLNLALAATSRFREVVSLVWRILTKHYKGSSTLRYFTASKIRVEADPPLRLQIDGEAIGETPCEIEVVPNAVRLLVPRDYAESKELSFTPNPLT